MLLCSKRALVCTALPETKDWAMKISELKGLPLTTLSDSAKAGTVDEVFLDQQLQHVVAFRIKRGLLGPRALVNRDDIAAIDETAGITVADPSLLTEQDEHAEPENAVSFDHVKGIHMITESGTALGTIADVHVDIDARQVIAYTLAGSRLAHLNRVEPNVLAEYALRRDENGNLIVADAAAEEVNQPDWKIAQGYIER
jgi:uncharacterized protein YrrD